jgi:hypothetical protein
MFQGSLWLKKGCFAAVDNDAGQAAMCSGITSHKGGVNVKLHAY